MLSFVYILGSVILLSVGSPWPVLRRRPTDYAMTCWVLFLVFSVGLGWLPLRLGLRKVARFEL